MVGVHVVSAGPVDGLFPPVPLRCDGHEPDLVETFQEENFQDVHMERFIYSEQSHSIWMYCGVSSVGAPSVGNKQPTRGPKRPKTRKTTENTPEPTQNLWERVKIRDAAIESQKWCSVNQC